MAKTKQLKQQEAAARQDKRAARTPQEQAALVNSRRGNSEKEKRKLLKKVAASTFTHKVVSGDYRVGELAEIIDVDGKSIKLRFADEDEAWLYESQLEELA